MARKKGREIHGWLIVDKPAGIGSTDVVSKVRWALDAKKAGHAGTLDPMATGVLVIGIERATKILGLIAGTSKSYDATIRLGRSTTTDDAEGEVLQSVSAAGVGDVAIADAVAALRGEIEQVPSAVSAIKLDGKRAYQLARVTLDRFDIVAVHRNVDVGDVVDVDVTVDCSSGTYVRALARDIGVALGVGGHLIALRRTRVGGFGLGQAH